MPTHQLLVPDGVQPIAIVADLVAHQREVPVTAVLAHLFERFDRERLARKALLHGWEFTGLDPFGEFEGFLSLGAGRPRVGVIVGWIGVQRVASDQRCYGSQAGESKGLAPGGAAPTVALRVPRSHRTVLSICSERTQRIRLRCLIITSVYTSM